MKRIIFVPFFIIVFAFMLSCSADYDETSYSNEDKATQLKNEILEIASDYGLNIEINGLTSSNDVDSINIQEVEAIFKAIAAVRGIYKMDIYKKGNVMEAKQRSVMNKRRTKLDRSSETLSYYSCEFVDKGTGSPFQVVNGYGFDFSCSCSAGWYSDSEGHISTVNITPKADILNYRYSSDVSDVSYSWHSSGDSGFSFEGRFKIIISLSSLTNTSVKMGFAGNCTPSEGSVYWYPD